MEIINYEAYVKGVYPNAYTFKGQFGVYVASNPEATSSLAWGYNSADAYYHAWKYIEEQVFKKLTN